MHLCIGAKGAEYPDPLVTLDMKQASVRKVLTEITRQTGIAFSYESSVLKHLPPVDIRVSGKPLSHCLRELFAGLPVIYIRVGQFVILKKKPKKAAAGGVVRGKTPSSDSLTIGIQRLGEVIVTADSIFPSSVHTAEMGHTRLDRTAIRQTPVLFGEADVIKTLQTMPGVTAGTAGLAGMYVRGGNGDDNLYLIEGNPLYQVHHVGGLFSAFHPEAVKDVEFFKSSFPARYGGRLSSVVDVHTKDGNMEEYHGSAMLGLTSGGLHLEGPIVKDRTSFNFSLRRSWLDVLSAPAIAIWNSTRNNGKNKLVARYAFTDLNLKLNHRFSDRSRGYAGLYWGNDFLKGGEKESGENGYEKKDIGRLRWGNLMAFAGWNYAFGSQWSGHLNTAYTRYASRLKSDYSEGTEDNRIAHTNTTRNSINDFSLKASFDYRPHARHHLRFGSDYIHHRFRPEQETIAAHEWAVYAEEDWKASRRIRLDAGLRFGLYGMDGQTHWSWEPRLSMRFLVNPQWSIKASYTRMSQYVHQLNESYINLPTDTWVPVGGKFKPMVSDQVALGSYYDTRDKAYSFSVEGYYKWMNHLLDYKDNYQLMPPSASWEDQLTQGKGRSYGVEVTARKHAGKVSGSIGYTLSWSDRQFDDINQGKRFPAKFDNRHKLNLVGNWKVSSKVELTGSWTYMTGNRITVSFENYETVTSPQLFPAPSSPMPGSDLVPPFMDDAGVSHYTGRNNYRLPAYHRLDLGINIYRPKQKGRMGIWNVSIYNVYSYMAPVSIRKRYWTNAPCYFEKLGLVPIIPSVSYTYKF